jgi:hypothetical protein
MELTTRIKNYRERIKVLEHPNLPKTYSKPPLLPGITERT